MQDKTESLIRKAENFYRRGAFERTEKIFRRILKTEADNCRVLTLLPPRLSRSNVLLSENRKAVPGLCGQSD